LGSPPAQAKVLRAYLEKRVGGQQPDVLQACLQMELALHRY
jgi:hypothetical protein